MTVLRMDNVGIVFDDLKAAVAFLVELGPDLGGEMQSPNAGPSAPLESTIFDVLAL